MLGVRFAFHVFGFHPRKRDAWEHSTQAMPYLWSNISPCRNPQHFPSPHCQHPPRNVETTKKKNFVPQFPCSSQSNLKGEMNLSIIVSVTKTFFFFLLLSLFREEIAPLTIRVIERPEKASEASSRMRMCWWPGADERSDRCVVL